MFSFHYRWRFGFNRLDKQKSSKLYQKRLYNRRCAVWLIVDYVVFTELLESFKHKPTPAELVGEYHITEVTNLNFNKSTYDKYRLRFKSDSAFTLTPTPNIDVCDSGRYEVDYSFENNELTYRCGKGYISGQIDRQFGDFRIEFIVDDPDGGQSIYFEK